MRRSTTTIAAGFVALILGLIDVGPANAKQPTPGNCDAIGRRGVQLGVAAALRCEARAARRDGTGETTCRRRAERLVTKRLTRGNGTCAEHVPANLTTLDRCVQAVRAELHGGGACVSGKLDATRGHVVRLARSATGLRPRAARPLCRAFARAGRCAGSCETVASALTACLEATDGDAPPDEPGEVEAPDPGDEVVAFGTYEGDAISTASLVGPDGVTGTARVVVAEGETRLHVVLSSFDATIWRFEGATARVVQVVLVGPSVQGVTGIAAERVRELAGPPAVPYWWDPSSPEGRAARAALERALGYAVDTFAGAYATGTVVLPEAAVTESERTTAPPPGFDLATYWMGQWFSPGGVVAIDPADVVPAGRTEPYTVLPQGFGLSQLVATGAIESRDGYFYIARAIPRFPPGLNGAHSVSFVLGRDVPLPPGDPGHSCVISEATGQPVGGLAFLCHVAPPSDTTCDLPAPRDDERIVTVGAYEGDTISTASVAGPDEPTDVIRVRVASGAEPLYVVLSSFDTVIWRFEGSVERIRRVVLVGVRQSGTIGIPPSRVTDRTASVGSLYDARCFAPFWDAQSPEGVAARAAVTRALGRAADVHAGTYSVGTLHLPSAAVEATPTPPPPAGLDPLLYLVATWFSPGGVLAIDAASVVPSAEPYEVLPRGFGLAQLVAAGALQPHTDSPVLGTFYIARPIPRFPAGLHGAHAVRFVLGRGVPMPAGDPGHSCVISEETGRPIGMDLTCSIFGDG